MRSVEREGGIVLFPSSLEVPDQGWGAIVAAHVQQCWPPPAWLSLVRAGDAERTAPCEVIAKAS